MVIRTVKSTSAVLSRQRAQSPSQVWSDRTQKIKRAERFSVKNSDKKLNKMLISQNGDVEKADKSNTKMSAAVDTMNNADAIREKTNSLNAQKIKNISNLVHNQSCSEKNNFCNDELKKHVSILCKYLCRHSQI